MEGAGQDDAPSMMRDHLAGEEDASPRRIVTRPNAARRLANRPKQPPSPARQKE